MYTMTFRLHDTAVDLAQNYNFEIMSNLKVHYINTQSLFSQLTMSKADGKYCP